MPYIPIAPLSRRGEKVAPFLSVQNITGIVVAAGPVWLLTLSLPDVLRLALVLLMAALGYLLTLDMRGMSLAERALWRGRGRVRQLVHGRMVTPADLPGVAAAQRIIIATPHDSPFQLRRSAPLPAPRAQDALDARALSALRRAQLRAASAPDPVGAPNSLVISDADVDGLRAPADALATA